MAGPAAPFFASVQKEFIAKKKDIKHDVYKFVIGQIKSIMDAKSMKEAAVKISAEVLKTGLGVALGIGTLGVDALVGFGTGKVVDKGANTFVTKVLEGKGVKLSDGPEYTFERGVGDAMSSAVQHCLMLVDADKAYNEAVQSFIKTASEKEPSPEKLFKKLKAMVFAFQALIWVWNKVSRDAAAIKVASTNLEKFIDTSGDALAKQQDALLNWVDAVLKENPGLALAKLW